MFTTLLVLVVLNVMQGAQVLCQLKYTPQCRNIRGAILAAASIRNPRPLLDGRHSCRRVEQPWWSFRSRRRAFTHLKNAFKSSHSTQIRLVVLFLSTIAWAMHVAAFVVPYFLNRNTLTREQQVVQMQDLLYIKNQFFAFVLLFTFVQYLDFLTVRQLST